MPSRWHSGDVGVTIGHLCGAACKRKTGQSCRTCRSAGTVRLVQLDDRGKPIYPRNGQRRHAIAPGLRRIRRRLWALRRRRDAIAPGLPRIGIGVSALILRRPPHSGLAPRLRLAAHRHRRFGAHIAYCAARRIRAWRYVCGLRRIGVGVWALILRIAPSAALGILVGCCAASVMR